MNIPKNETVWVFNGEGARFPSGVFPSRAEAELWIGRHKLSGVLTEYPLGVGIYEWAIENDFFEPKSPDQKAPKFIGRFSSGNLVHVHYENGVTVA